MSKLSRTGFWILVSGALILALSLGIRHGFGLFLAPMSAEFGWGRETFAFAIALQNLIWGTASVPCAPWWWAGSSTQRAWC